MVKSKCQTNRERYSLIGEESAKQEATACPNCRKATPTLNMLSGEEWEQLKQKAVARSRVRFLKGKEAVEKQVRSMRDIAFQLKIAANFTGTDCNEVISSPSFSVHTEDVNSNDVTKSFA